MGQPKGDRYTVELEMRDYDFSVLLLEHNKDQAKFSTPEDFGDLHGKLFRLL